uniref:RRM domain-containing protein n=1 Tax=Vitrella brassicaformis TaxID=1169539 RepID=A0A7S1JN46_9ALVE
MVSDPRALYVAHLPDGCTKEHLEELAKDLRGFKEARLVPGRAEGFYAFVDFADAECCRAALPLLEDKKLPAFPSFPGLKISYARTSKRIREESPDLRTAQRPRSDKPPPRRGRERERERERERDR